MDGTMTSPADAGRELLELYDSALPSVYGYLVRRCGSVPVAEDLTSETFLAAVDAVQRDAVPELSTAWLVGVARHKLVDHWRRQEREERKLALVDAEPVEERWEVDLDRLIALDVLAGLGPHHRAALTLRYLDGLPVREVAAHLDRTVGATEVLLVRARRAFREAYTLEAGDAPGGDGPAGADPSGPTTREEAP
ncbi:sigma-70 family RNA polymerase sigma factor [Dermatobacter hominis]|nr:sigma-70 family RNA polymerase sigma factor [Dermatobacter hominis]UDY36951.1 sigma-70 family RNA polymerase sigma factor [Dermatobacter hominis]